MKSFKKFIDTDNHLHHMSFNNFNQFKSFSHFGTIKSSKDRMYSKMGDIDDDNEHLGTDKKYPKHVYHYKVKLNLGRTVHISDIKNHHLDDLMDALHRHGHITKEDSNDFQNKHDSEYASHKQLKKHALRILKKNKIDSISYDNDFEDRNSKSYIIPEPKRIKIVKKNRLINNA